MYSSFDQIWLQRAILVVILVYRRGIPRELAIIIAGLWALAEFRLLQISSRGGYYWSDLNLRRRQAEYQPMDMFQYVKKAARDWFRRE